MPSFCGERGALVCSDREFFSVRLFPVLEDGAETKLRLEGGSQSPECTQEGARHCKHYMKRTSPEGQDPPSDRSGPFDSSERHSRAQGCNLQDA